MNKQVGYTLKTKQKTKYSKLGYCVSELNYKCSTNSAFSSLYKRKPIYFVVPKIQQALRKMKSISGNQNNDSMKRPETACVTPSRTVQ